MQSAASGGQGPGRRLPAVEVEAVIRVNRTKSRIGVPVRAAIALIEDQARNAATVDQLRPRSGIGDSVA
ncbi:MAG TPA: hypothetical protein VIP76_03300, partial [Luteimonas sp.]